MGQKENQRNQKKQIAGFIGLELLLGVVLFLNYYEAWVNKMDGTVLAFSYKYGFISRGLIGSFYQWLDKILPVNMMRYEMVVVYTFWVTMIFFGVLLFFFAFCLQRGMKYLDTCSPEDSDRNSVRQMEFVMIFFTIFAVPIFSAHYNFGRPDLYCLLLSVVGAMLLMWGRWEWLLIPISALGVMVHQGNVFMYLNIILVLLLYKAFSREKKERRKYLMLFAACFLTASALFLWFECFSHVNGEAIYEEIVNTANQLCRNGKCHQDVIDKEILGIDLADREVESHRGNFVQFPIFLLLMLPYLLLLVRFFRGLIGSAEKGIERWKYLLVAVGAGTMLPDLLLKIDYGRWMFAILSYYCVMLMVLHAMGDKKVWRNFAEATKGWRDHPVKAAVFLLYPMALQPFMDVSINPVTERVADFINESLHLGWW